MLIRSDVRFLRISPLPRGATRMAANVDCCACHAAISRAASRPLAKATT